MTSLQDVTLRFFDERWYASEYPDVVEAVKNGRFGNLKQHYILHGNIEGRLPFEFDAQWYTSTYPTVLAEIADGIASTALEHYCKFGFYRGYLANIKGRRVDNPARILRRFGGFWIDSTDSFDLIRGKVSAGLITEEEGELLNFFRTQGYVVLRSALSTRDLEEARAELEGAFSGSSVYKELLFECPKVGNGHIRWDSFVTQYPAKAIDIHMFGKEIRNAVFCPKLLRILRLICDANPLATQTLGFLRGSAQEAHQDGAYVPYSIAGKFVASWIALEDVTEEAGELFYYPESHLFDDFFYGERFKSVFEARRNGVLGEMLEGQIKEHVIQLPKEAKSRGLKKEKFMPKAGDILLWHADLVHGGSPISRLATRKSLVTHYCPDFIAPGYFENKPCSMFKHESGARYSSSVYAKAI
jgi:phytanoyl-CoA hydroxylase